MRCVCPAPVCGAVVFACCAVGDIGAAAGQDESYAQSKLEVAYTVYLSEGREMEITLAPVSGIPVLAPVRLFAAGMVANLVVTANRFEASVQPDPTRPLRADPIPQ